MPTDVLNENGLIRSFARNHPRSFAVVLGTAVGEEAEAILAGLSEPELISVLAQLPQFEVKQYLDNVEDDVVLRWLEVADIDDASRLAIRLTRERCRRLIRQVQSLKRRTALGELIDVRPNTAAALAEKEYAWFSHKCTAGEALTAIRRHHEEESLPVLVLDDADRVIGLADILVLIRLADDELAIKCLQRVPLIPSNATIQTVINQPAWRITSHLPVVDRNGRPIGLLSRQRLGDAADLRDDTAMAETNILLDISTSMVDILRDSVRAIKEPRS